MTIKNPIGVKEEGKKEHPFKRFQFSCMMKLPPHIGILLFWICVLISAGFYDLHSLLEYSIAVTEYGEAHILSVIEFADLSGTLFHHQTSSFSQRTSLQSLAIFHHQLICSVQLWRKCHGEKHSQERFTAVWYRQDSSIILGNRITGRIIPS